jgi:hypothetical protein
MTGVGFFTCDWAVHESRGNDGTFQISRFSPRDAMKLMPPAGPIKFARA